MTSSAKNCLILFTRYPIVGTTKTRLIPHLGAEQAADLQRQMTEYMVDMTSPLRRSDRCTMAVYFTDSSLSQMQAWLGPQLTYRPQQGRDLGQRLHHAFSHSFGAGFERVVVTGSDCPAITPDHVEQAFHQLGNHDLVLGPALDGGYYLVGLSRRCAELFQGITWGSDQVFAQTVAIAQRLNLAWTALEPLRDIDRPEDLTTFLPLKSA
ncbi:MAG: TIGR04282 family arsenosugar biosynthesis glycosyltransferase [Cyanobacteria bacterium]|nr:TIGR04282 family arsenosugar biosynthesis glycosyltransferase [Cyanobacteriota bacterium]